MNKLKLSLAYSLLERYASGAASLISLMIVSRIMNAREVGVYFIGLSIINLVNHVRDLGVANYLLQAPSVELDEARTVATMICASSWVMAGALAGVSGPLARFYVDPTLEPVLLVLALAVAVAPFGEVFMILLRREMDFRRISAINLGANLTGAIVTIALTLLGFGPISLALGFAALSLATTLLAMVSRPQFSLLVPTTTGWRRILGFGAYSAGVGLLAQLARSAPDIILGRLIGVEAVGLYGRAMTVLNLFNRAVLDAVRPVALPAFAAEARAGRGMASLYIPAIEHMTVLFWPFLAVVALLTEPITTVLLGPNWLGSAPLLRILAIAAALGFPSFLTYSLMVALGRVRDCFWMGVISVPIAVGLLVVAGVHSLEAAAWSSIPASALDAAIQLVFIERRAGIPVRRVLAASGKSVLVTIAVASAVEIAAMVPEIALSTPLVKLLVTGGIAVPVWLLAAAGVRHAIWLQLQVIFRRLRPVAG